WLDLQGDGLAGEGLDEDLPSEKTVTSWICTSNSTAEMNAKIALAMILALQVSMSLCDIPSPAPDLVEKYDQMKSVFYKRLITAYGKLQAAVAPLVDNVDSEKTQVVKEYIETLQTKPEFQAVAKVAVGLGEEVGPLVDRTRTAVLGLYGHYLRPRIGDALGDAIDNIKVYLNKYLPTE
ncbi:hypothetical protein QKW60_20980, partial [Defluviimonas aestuarii]